MRVPVRVLVAIGSMHAGGSERQALELLKRLDRARYVPFLYLIDRAGELLPEVPPDVPVFGFRERHGPPRWNVPGRIHRMQVRDLAEIVQRERIELIYDRTYHMTLVTAAAGRRAPVRRVSVVVSDPRRDLAQSAGRFRLVKRRLLQRAYREADRVVTVSEGVRRAVIDYHRLAPEHVITLYNPVDAERIDRLAAAEAPPLEPDRFHVLGVGRLSVEKGWDRLLVATDELINRRGRGELRVHLLGQGPLEAALRERIRGLGLEQAFRLEGFQANPYCWLRRANLVCLPSLYEGLPNVLLEAMACGVPVVASDCASGPREILDGGRFGRLVPPGDTRALADAIEDAIRDEAQWKERAPAAQAHVRRNFSPERTMDRIQELFDEVVSQRKESD